MERADAWCTPSAGLADKLNCTAAPKTDVHDATDTLQLCILHQFRDMCGARYVRLAAYTNDKHARSKYADGAYTLRTAAEE